MPDLAANLVSGLATAELANEPKQDNSKKLFMSANRSDRLRRIKEFEVNQNRRRANQIETMIGEFDRVCIDLEGQMKAEEMRARVYDPTDFAYPESAKAAAERRANLQRSADALRLELDRLRSEAKDVLNPQFAA